MTENQRLKFIINSLNLTQKAFSEAIGIKQGSLSDVLRQKNGLKVSESIKFKLENLYSINRTWLETGEGEMFITTNTLKETSRKTISNARLIGDFHATEYEDGSRFRQIGPGIFTMKVELVTEKAKAGWLRGFADAEYQEELPIVETIVDFVAKGKYLAFEVDGDSMDDRTIDCIPHKTIIVGRELPQHQWQPRLHNHEYPNWIFVHKNDGILVKQIGEQNLEDGWLIHHSLNPNKELYPDEKIFLKDIYKIYNVVKRILP